MALLHKKSNRSAFTIIETLAIICAVTLSISVVYFAKKMIQENDVKSLVMQIKKYDVALNNFTEKYHALPGDVTDTIQYGISETNTDGNGDNIITDRFQKTLMANGEITNFWMHLSKTQMLDEIYESRDDAEAKTGITFPLSKIGKKVGIITYGADGKTFYQIGFDFADSDRIYTKNNSLKTDEALLFDRKIDDGNPKRGRVVAAGADMLNGLENIQCIKFDEYNQNYTNPICQLRIEAN
jgi:hypothetical protein